MANRSPSKGRQEHPKGALRTVDDVTRERIRAAIRAKGWEQKDLAAKLDVSPASITNLLKPGPARQIKYLPELLDALDLEDELQEVIEAWSDIPAEIRKAIAAIVASHRKP